MKRLLLCLGLGVCLIFSASLTQASITTAGHKIKDGIKDIVTSPKNVVEITSEQVRRTKGDGIWHGSGLGFAAGIMEGTASMVSQMFQGVVKIVTFPVD